MFDFSYQQIESQIADLLRVIRPAAECYWEREGPPGEDSGPYIFFPSVVGVYVDILLEMHESPARDALLQDAFELVDFMLRSDDLEVGNLAFIAILESQPLWWYARALPFIGPEAQRQLDKYIPDWRSGSPRRRFSEPSPELIDLYGVRPLIARALAHEGIELEHVPGTTHLDDPAQTRRSDNRPA
jgi:hypothetical protein